MNKQIIAIAGLVGSGKNTAADYLIHRHHYTPLAFADSLKDATAAIFSWPRWMLEGNTVESREWRETVDEWWANRLGIPHLTPRWVLQNLGTNVLRSHFHDEIWIAALQRKLHDAPRKIVITDLRFPNELAALRSYGATVVRVQRGIEPPWVEVLRSDPDRFHREWPHIHPSEWWGVVMEYDGVINNNTGLDDLYAQVREHIKNH